MRLRPAVIVVVVAELTASVLAQPAAERLAFELASIKASQPGSTGYAADVLQIRRGGQLNGRSISVRALIRVAYRLQDYALADGPAWMADERFDIDAKANVDLGNPLLTDPRRQPSALQLMLRSLLVERFKLATHAETRTLPIYGLIFAAF